MTDTAVIDIALQTMILAAKLAGPILSSASPSASPSRCSSR